MIFSFNEKVWERKVQRAKRKDKYIFGGRGGSAFYALYPRRYRLKPEK